MAGENWFSEFERRFGDGGEVRVFFAPGRVNLIGEHTDYTGGYVFPAALTFGTWVMVRPRRDGWFRFASRQMEREVHCRVDEIRYRSEDGWANYPKGIIRQFLEQGVQMDGADMLFHGNIPMGSGLSSSASIEMATAVACQALAGTDWPMVELVKMAQRAENRFIGVQCGIMDQFASGMGRKDHAILLHCDTLRYRYAPLELGDYRLVITHTNKPRELADSKYNERRAECEEGFRQIRPWLENATCLGEVDVDTWQRVRERVSDPTIRKRLTHVVEENARVHASVEALEQGDLIAFGRLMMQSHESLRDLYEVTGKELDALFDAARQVDGCIGTRMTGAGFGGCTVSLVHLDALGTFQEEVGKQYERQTGLTPTFYTAEIGDGAHEVSEEVFTSWRFS
ncbi:galactokinase [Polycladomyces abyssicola]|uniref:Galactokinase n=1 Tax=Polycladomyces abyssicola TaxID=1125966 RepID=A0A8D5UFL1_9BACL|nr:galactokinase [Polycladomyces abyssicola]BCU82204.1 galactokinase [Polycladomyces abyssicola]